MMNQFEDLIDKDRYQIFLCKSLCSLPLTFATHTWFVINKKGALSRWDVIHMNKSSAEKTWGHLVFNLQAPFLGVWVLPYFTKTLGNFKTELISSFSSDENGPAKRMIDFIENSPNTYKYCKVYSYTGPNSNTYTVPFENCPRPRHLPIGTSWFPRYRYSIESNGL